MITIDCIWSTIFTDEILEGAKIISGGLDLFNEDDVTLLAKPSLCSLFTTINDGGVREDRNSQGIVVETQDIHSRLRGFKSLE